MLGRICTIQSPIACSIILLVLASAKEHHQQEVQPDRDGLVEFMGKIRGKDTSSIFPINKDESERVEDGGSGEYGRYYEGDMVVEVSKTRNRMLMTNYWKNGVIPFDFDRRFTLEDRKKVLNIVNYLNQKTCLHFRKYWYFLDKNSYVKITNEKPGCFATVGRPTTGKGKVNLSPTCMSKDGVIIHELLHSAGIFHEHSRYDRDSYVKIHWENMQPGDQHNFVMRNNFQVFNIPYDYYSIMHYSTHAYTKNGLPTLEPKRKIDLKQLGQRNYLTTSDLEKLQRIYCH